MKISFVIHPNTELLLEKMLTCDNVHIVSTKLVTSEDFRVQNSDEYHNLYMQSNTLVLADVFENFCNKCKKIYKLDSSYFLSAPRLVWQACLKKTELEFELLTNADMLLFLEKGIRGGMCHAIYRYTKANNKYMKNYDLSTEPSYLMYWDANNL